MKRKISCIAILLLCMMLSLTGCGAQKEKQTNDIVENTENTKNDEKVDEIEKNIFLEVLENKKTYIDEENEEKYFNNYLKKYESEQEMKVSYTILDMDNDNNDEMVVLCESFDGFYLILNYEAGKVYGFEEVYRGLTNLKTTGEYWGSGGAATGTLQKSKFEKNKRLIETIAEMDMGIYKIGNEEVTESEFNEYLEKEFYSKNNAQWTSYKTMDAEENTVLETGTYVYTVPNNGTEIAGSTQTITIEKSTIVLEDNYLGTKKIGTYVLNNQTLVATFDKEIGYNQGTDSEYTQQISEEKQYIIDGEKITINENGITKNYIKQNDN